MSASTWPSWARSVSSSADAQALATEGDAAVLRAWAEGLRPDPALTVAAWADRHRVLSPRAAAEPGR